MDYQKVFEGITNEHSAKILNWAVKKTGNRQEGEDLAQEVLLQIFIAISKQDKVEKLENFIWKVAHFVWCNRLRSIKKENNITLLDELIKDKRDFVYDFVEQDWLDIEIKKMRKKIANLSFIQREALILHYIEGMSIKEVACILNTTESSITWHLFDARKRVKRELDIMKTDISYVYRPGELHLAASGMVGNNPDTERVNDNLIRQNICLLCYKEPKNIDELAELTGIPKPYLEYDIKWLTQHEFLSIDGKKYSTIIPILDKKHFKEIAQFYNNARKDYIDKIIEYLWNHEEDIRNIGFYGCDFKTEKLMWSIIMLFTSYAARNSEICIKLKRRDERQIRPDGGKYYVIGMNLSDDKDLNLNGYNVPEGWDGYDGICSSTCTSNGDYDNYYWLGFYNFKSKKYHPEIINEENEYLQKIWYELFCRLVEPNFKVDELTVEQKEKLAISIQEELVCKDKNEYKPNFVIMTKEQLDKLQSHIFKPLLETIEPNMKEAVEYISKIHKKNMPRVNKGYIDYFTYMDIWEFGIYTLIFAAEDNKLYIPETPEKGVPLTLVIVK